MDSIQPNLPLPEDFSVQKKETHLPTALLQGKAAVRTLSLIEERPRPSEEASLEAAFDATVQLPAAKLPFPLLLKSQ